MCYVDGLKRFADIMSEHVVLKAENIQLAVQLQISARAAAALTLKSPLHSLLSAKDEFKYYIKIK